MIRSVCLGVADKHLINNTDKVKNNNAGIFNSNYTNYILNDNNEKEYLYDMYVRNQLENLIYDLRTECEKHTPWILSKATTNDIYNFIECYINKEESIPGYLLNDNEYINSDQNVYEDEYYN